MLTIEEYASYDATGLAELVRTGDAKPSEIHEAGVRAVELADTHVHASVEGPWNTPLDAAEDAPFTGVPFVVKDILCHAAGVPVHMGSRALASGIVFDDDTELMSRFRRAGLAAVCTTKTPEFALNGTTEPLLGGPALNPWDPARSPGGSSGASAALVATGAVPVAHGNDGAGSLRIPAAHTGTVGLKPSRGRVPIGPDIQEAFYGNAVEFAITRTVRDAAGLLDAVHGNLVGERYSAPLPAGRYADARRQRPLRIAVWQDSWSGYPIHADVAAALASTAQTLEELGHHVEIAAPQLNWDEFLESMTIAFCAGTAAAALPLAQALGIGLDRNHFEATTIACAEAGRNMTPVDLARMYATYNAVDRALGTFMADWDVLVSPVSATPPVLLGTYDADDESLDGPGWAGHIIPPHATCALYNVTGAPAISLPLGVSGDGLPIGVQFGAEIYREDLLLGLATELEQARPWADRRPALHVTNLGGGS